MRPTNALVFHRSFATLLSRALRLFAPMISSRRSDRSPILAVERPGEVILPHISGDTALLRRLDKRLQAGHLNLFGSGAQCFAGARPMMSQSTEPMHRMSGDMVRLRQGSLTALARQAGGNARSTAKRPLRDIW